MTGNAQVPMAGRIIPICVMPIWFGISPISIWMFTILLKPITARQNRGKDGDLFGRPDANASSHRLGKVTPRRPLRLGQSKSNSNRSTTRIVGHSQINKDLYLEVQLD